MITLNIFRPSILIQARMALVAAMEEVRLTTMTTWALSAYYYRFD